MLYDRAGGKHMELAESFDRSVDEIVCRRDGKRIYFTAENEGEKPLY